MCKNPGPALLLFAATLMLSGSIEVEARVFMTREKALEMVYGEEAEFRRESVFPTEKQVTRARSLAGPGVTVREAPLTRYTAWSGERLLGTAYLDTHLVRTLPQTVLVFVTPAGKVDNIEILSFDEPGEYLPRANWLEQFDGSLLDDQLAIGGRIHGMTGATLSAHAVTDAARRALAFHLALASDGRGGEPGP